MSSNKILHCNDNKKKKLQWRVILSDDNNTEQREHVLFKIPAATGSKWILLLSNKP